MSEPSTAVTAEPAALAPAADATLPFDGQAAVGRWGTTDLIALVPAVLVLLCSVASDMVALLGADPLGVWRLLPAGPVAGDWIGAEVSSTAFLLVGIALLRRKRAGYWMALAMAAGGLIVQGATLDHPISVATAAAVGVVLVATRERYDAGTGRRELVLAIALLGVALVLAAGAALAAANGADDIVTVADGVGALLDLATPVAVPGLATVGALLVAGRLAYVLASVLVLDPRPDDRSPEVLARARATLERVGSGALYPYQLAPECTAWADADGTAALAVAHVGRAEVALGDPSGAPAAAASVLDAWLERCRRSDVVPTVYQATDALARRQRARGWLSVTVGREAVLDPGAFDLSTPRMANLRHTITRSRRGGVSTVWSAEGVAGLPDPGTVAGLIALDAAWRRSAGPSMGFTVGRFDPRAVGPSAIAVAHDADGRPTAFCVLRPTGADGGWVLDIMRRERDGVPGALEASLAAAVAGLGALGVRRLSLGLAPLTGLDPASPSRSERWLARGARLARPFYNTDGLAFFKDKFAPVWEPRFLLVPGWTSLPTGVIALLRLHLGGSWGRVVKSVASGVAQAR